MSPRVQKPALAAPSILPDRRTIPHRREPARRSNWSALGWSGSCRYPCSSINRPKRHDIRSYRRIGLTANGRSDQQPVSARFHDALEACVVASGEESPSTVAALNVWVVADPNYPTGLRSVQRYVRRAYPLPACRVRCRVATRPWTQARASWASFPRVWVGGTRRDLLAFVLTFQCASARVCRIV